MMMDLGTTDQVTDVAVRYILGTGLQYIWGQCVNGRGAGRLQTRAELEALVS